jgi:hypothetical protein
MTAGPRVLIINCDDLGMHPAINAAVIDAIEHGVAGSCSLMVTCPAISDAMEQLRRRPEIPFGVHLTLVCDTPRHRWGPLTAREKVPSLLDPPASSTRPPTVRRCSPGRASTRSNSSSARRSPPCWTPAWRRPTSTSTASPTVAATTSST